jgi:glutaredoxin
MWNVGFLLLIIAAAVLSYQWFFPKEGMTDLDRVSKIKSGDGVLVFTMEGCGHCKAMKETLDKLTKESTAIAVVDTSDATEETKKLTADMNIKSYPTIFQFKGGVPTDVSNSRSYDELKSLLPASSMQ